ncbi:MAG: hypothetical protein AAFU65_00030 [Pseudomonadota bacterium]
MQTHLRRSSTAVLATLITAGLGLSACGSAADAERFDGMSITFKAATDADGNCRPERTIEAQVEATGLHAIRGDSDYRLPEGTTSIPFQEVFRAMDDDGFSDSDAITILNFNGPCSDLVIDIDVAYCEYYGESSVDKKACPAMKVTGTEGFAAVNIVRSDQQ